MDCSINVEIEGMICVIAGGILVSVKDLQPKLTTYSRHHNQDSTRRMSRTRFLSQSHQ